MSAASKPQGNSGPRSSPSPSDEGGGSSSGALYPTDPGAPPGHGPAFPGQRRLAFSPLELDTSLQTSPSGVSLASSAGAAEAGGTPAGGPPPPALFRPAAPPGLPGLVRTSLRGEPSGASSQALPGSPTGRPPSLASGSGSHFCPTSVLDLETTELLASLTEEGMADAAGAAGTEPPLPPSPQAASPFQQAQAERPAAYLRQHSGKRDTMGGVCWLMLVRSVFSH